jgi:hypothetical protein
MESAIKSHPVEVAEWALQKARRDSQGSLPKTGFNPYLDDKAMEL